MNDPKWLSIAKSLPYGHRRKILCCGSTPSMIVNHGAKGYSAHCFRDDSHGGFVGHGTLSLAELAERQVASSALRSGPIELPRDFTTDIPDRHRLWLLRASVSSSLALAYGFGYSASSDRVILPVYRDGTLIAYTARATGPQTPKYIARQREDVTDALFYSNPATLLPSADSNGFDLVLVEDILSAVRVGRLVQAAALLGTTVAGKEETILSGLRNNPVIGLWLDGDKAGRKARERIARRLVLLGATVIRINTPLDPKRYSNAQIRSILRDRFSTAASDEVPQGLQPDLGCAAEG